MLRKFKLRQKNGFLIKKRVKTFHDVKDLANLGWLKMQNLIISRTKHNFGTK